jgi:head-tail adaptor
MMGLFDKTGTIYRIQKTKNALSGRSESVVKVGITPCRVSTYKAKDTERFDREKQAFIPTHTIYTPADVDVRNDDRIQVEEWIFEIKDVRNPSLMGHHFEMDARLFDRKETKVFLSIKE